MATGEHTQSGSPVVLSTRTLVGRATGAELVLPGSGVSGEHAALFWEGARWCARDLESRSGTWVNEARLEPVVARTLSAGDAIKFGEDLQRWLYFDDLCGMLGRSRQRVNVEGFRARQQRAAPGIVDAVERFQQRPTTRQIRLGVQNLTIEPL